MGVYLYHPDWHKRPAQLRVDCELVDLQAVLRGIESVQYSVEDEAERNRLDAKWHATFQRYQKLHDRVERGYFTQWTTLLQRAVGVPRPEFDERLFSLAEMRQIRSRIRKLLQDGFAAFQDFYYKEGPLPLTFKCWTNTLKWAEEIFSNGLRDSKQVYLA